MLSGPPGADAPLDRDRAAGARHWVRRWKPSAGMQGYASTKIHLPRPPMRIPHLDSRRTKGEPDGTAVDGEAGPNLRHR